MSIPFLRPTSAPKVAEPQSGQPDRTSRANGATPRPASTPARPGWLQGLTQISNLWRGSLGRTTVARAAKATRQPAPRNAIDRSGAALPNRLPVPAPRASGTGLRSSSAALLSGRSGPGDAKETRVSIPEQIGQLPKSSPALRTSIELMEHIDKLPAEQAAPLLNEFHAILSIRNRPGTTTRENNLQLFARRVMGSPSATAHSASSAIRKQILDQIDQLPKLGPTLRTSIELMEHIDRLAAEQAAPLLKEFHAIMSIRNRPGTTTRENNLQLFARRVMGGPGAAAHSTSSAIRKQVLDQIDQLPKIK